MYPTTSPRTRRSFLHGGLLASLTLVASLGARPVSDVAAEKNDGRKPKSIASRANREVAYCEKTLVGTATVSKKRGGTTVTCKGGGIPGGPQGDYACTFFSKGVRCHSTKPAPSQATQPTQPTQPDGPVHDPGDGELHPLEPDNGEVPLT
jgi:hypothetical protein